LRTTLDSYNNYQHIDQTLTEQLAVEQTSHHFATDSTSLSGYASCMYNALSKEIIIFSYIQIIPELLNLQNVKRKVNLCRIRQLLQLVNEVTGRMEPG